MNFFKEVFIIWGVGFRMLFQLCYGTYRLSRLQQPIVAVFGGGGAYYKGKYAKWAYQFSEKMVSRDHSIITGGGPGVMEAANCGASEHAKDKKKATLGIRVYGVDGDFSNKCAPTIEVDYFFIRKWLLTHYSCGYVLFPGGVGTVDEFFEVINLMKLKKIQKSPVVLVGVEYWKDLIHWYDHAFESELIQEPLRHLVTITDDIDLAVETIIKGSLKR